VRVLVVHNRYRLSAGEDESVRLEIELLRRNGDDIELLGADNDSLDLAGTLVAGLTIVWNHAAYWRLRRLIRAFGPDVISVHNVMPQLSPSIYYAARAEGVPAVQTLHNFRLICPAGTLMRNGGVCLSCLGKGFALPGIRHACYRKSRLATAAVAAMSGVHNVVKTWRDVVPMYIALTEFSRRLFIEHGLPAGRIAIKPNFVLEDPGVGCGGQAALFVGRLSEEKGLTVLMRAWKLLSSPSTLLIVGDGPMRGEVQRYCGENAKVRWLGWRRPGEVASLMNAARVLIVPSICYETFGRTVIEAFATGLPVVASRLGSLAELVDHGRTGLLFRPGEAEDLAAKIDWAFSHPTELASMRKEARAEYEDKYTAERNYETLMGIYQRAIRALK
jgi:glycosyltransferase involved in cell wall biosynthesis